MAGAITAANIIIKYNSSEVDTGVKATRAELSKLARTLNETVPAAEKMKREIDVAADAHRKGVISARQYFEAVEQINKSYSRMNGVGATVTRVAAGFFGTYQILGQIRHMYQLTVELEQAQAAFEGLTGSARRADYVISSMRALDKISNLDFSNITHGAQTLLGYGIAASKTTTLLKQLADISRGNDDRFRSLSLAIGQVNAAGRLMGQEVLQFINAGFNPLQAISEATGRSMADLRKEMEAGKITVEMVFDAIDRATSDGGRFHRMSERMAETLGGKVKQSIAEYNDALRETGKIMTPTATKTLEYGAKAAKAWAWWQNAKIEGSEDILASMFDPLLGISGEQEKRKMFERMNETVVRLMNEADDLADKNGDSEDARTAKAIKRGEEMKASLEGVNAALKSEQDAIQRLQLSEEEYERRKILSSVDKSNMSKEEQKEANVLIQQALKALEKRFELERKIKQEKEEADIAEKRAQERKTAAAKAATEAERIRKLKEKEKEERNKAIADAPEEARRQVEEEMRDKKFGAVSAQGGSVEAYKLLLASNNEQRRMRIMAEKTRKRTNELLEQIKNKPAGAVIANARK
jgi:tape measure domain-containing protein